MESMHDAFFMKILRTMAAALCLVLFSMGTAHSLPKKVVYGFDKKFKPFSYVRNQKATGFEHDILAEILKRENIDFSSKGMKEWERVQAELSSNVIHVSSGMIKTPLRKKLFLFAAEPTLRQQAKFFIGKKSVVSNWRELRGKNVAVHQGSMAHRVLQDLGGFKVRPYENINEAVKALWLDDVEAYFGYDKQAYEVIDAGNYKNIAAVGGSVQNLSLYFAFYRNQTELKKVFDRGLRRMKADGSYDRIYRKWFVNELSKEERKKLIAEAAKAALNSYEPGAKVKHGAAVLSKSGRIYTGCCVMSKDPETGIGALESAISKAVAMGDIDLRAVVVADEKGRVALPSAQERRLLCEFGRGVLVVVKPYQGKNRTSTAAQLLPHVIR
jgi:cytidine deaminase